MKNPLTLTFFVTALTALVLVTSAAANGPERSTAIRSGSSVYKIAFVHRTLYLPAKPNGLPRGVVDPVTVFHSPTTLSVLEDRGDWLKVSVAEYPNGSSFWVKRHDVTLRQTQLHFEVDLSAHRLQLLDGKRLVLDTLIGVGAPETPTPPGRFFVTDKLSGPSYGRAYGCCILALSGVQTHLRPGWTGGNRLGIHGTDNQASIGANASNGCLHLTDAVMRRLLVLVPLGTPVFIHA
jgi:hypothetical protein